MTYTVLGAKHYGSGHNVKIVEWSEEDQAYVGSAPGLLYGGCHGPDERAVFDELCRIVEEAIAIYKKDGNALPPAHRAATSPTRSIASPS
jgi:hypothetical protein